MEDNILRVIKSLCYDRCGETFISLGHYGLDFSKEYKVLKFTDKGVRLAWQNGKNWVKCFGKIERRSDDRIVLFTEGWSFIEKLEV